MTIEVTLIEEEYRRFLVFDTFRRKKMWRSPAIFASIMGTSGAICFLMRHVDGAIMLGTILFLVGFGLPLVTMVNLLMTMGRQIKLHGLPRTVYTLDLSADKKGIRVKNDTEQAEYAWNKIHHVYRWKTATYLYITPARAFLLPHYLIPGGADALWQLLESCVSPEKLAPLK